MGGKGSNDISSYLKVYARFAPQSILQGRVSTKVKRNMKFASFVVRRFYIFIFFVLFFNINMVVNGEL